MNWKKPKLTGELMGRPEKGSDYGSDPGKGKKHHRFKSHSPAGQLFARSAFVVGRHNLRIDAGLNGFSSQVRLDRHQDAHQYCERNAVEENEPENFPFVSVPASRGGSDNDTLGVDHLTHYSAAAVGGGH